MKLKPNDFKSHNFGKENPKLDAIIKDIFGVSIKEEIEDQFRELADKQVEKENDAAEMLSNGYREINHRPTGQQ